MAAPENPSSSDPQPIEVFCSYSHRDELLREELDTHLNILQSNGVIASWHDHAIPAGKQWADEIDEHLNSAQIILLLISPDFLASKYCREVEVHRAMERHAAGEARVISIMLRDVDWHGSPLSKLQALPKNAKAVTQWTDRDQAFKDIAIGIRKVAEDLRRPAQSKRTGQRTEAKDTSRVAEMPPVKPPVAGKNPMKKYALVGATAVLLVAALGYLTLRGHLGKTLGDCVGASCGQALNPMGGGGYLGGIDLGSKGTKGAVFTFKKSENLDPQVIYHRAINTTLVSSMKDGQFTEEGIREASEAVKDLLDEMHAAAQKDKVTVIGYYVVASSGVGMAESKSKDALAASVKTATGMDLDFLDAKREGYFGMLTAVPSDKWQESLYIDIGSGNTKVGCLAGGTDLSSYGSEEIRYGSVTGRNRALEKNPRDVWDGIQQVMRDEVTPNYRQESMNTPCLTSRTDIYWTGGAAWAMATFMHPENALDEYVTFSRHDLDAFLSRLHDGSWNQKPLAYSFARDVSPAKREAIRQQAEKDRSDLVNRAFVREDLLSGVSIMKTVLGFSSPSAVIHFVRDSNYVYEYALVKSQQNGGSEAAKK